MKIETSKLKLLILSGLENLDPIKVMTENFEPGHGTITISYFGKAWTAGWPAMSGQTVEQFFSSSSADYLADCLCRGIPKHRYAEGDHADFIRQTVLEKRRAKEINPEQARESFDRADGMSMNDVLSDWNFESLWMPLFGDVCHAASTDWPTELNPDYTYLCRIVEAVKNAFITISTQPVVEVKHDRNPVGEIVAWSGTNREMGITREVDFRFLRFDVKPGTKLYTFGPAPELLPIGELIYRLESQTGETWVSIPRVRFEHAAWSQETFGDVGPVGPLKHLSKEALEAAAEPGDLSEWADMQFLLWDAQRRAGITDEQIEDAMIKKLRINKSRKWPEPKDGEPRLHVKDGD